MQKSKEEISDMHRRSQIPPLFVLLCLLNTTTKGQFIDEDYP
jgi:hypothetical protein